MSAVIPVNEASITLNMFEDLLTKAESGDIFAKIALLKHISTFHIDCPEIVIAHGKSLLEAISYTPPKHGFLPYLWRLLFPSPIHDHYETILEQVCLAAMHAHIYPLRNRCLELLEKECPRSYRVKLLRGRVMENAELYSDAEALYSSIIEENPSNHLVMSAYQRLISIHKALHHTYYTIKLLVDFTSIYIDNLPAWFELYQQYACIGRYEEAAFCAERLIIYEPSNHQHHLLAANAIYSVARKHFYSYQHANDYSKSPSQATKKKRVVFVKPPRYKQLPPRHADHGGDGDVSSGGKRRSNLKSHHHSNNKKINTDSSLSHIDDTKATRNDGNNHNKNDDDDDSEDDVFAFSNTSYYQASYHLKHRDTPSYRLLLLLDLLPISRWHYLQAFSLCETKEAVLGLLSTSRRLQVVRSLLPDDILKSIDDSIKASQSALTSSLSTSSSSHKEEKKTKGKSKLNPSNQDAPVMSVDQSDGHLHSQLEAPPSLTAPGDDSSSSTADTASQLSLAFPTISTPEDDLKYIKLATTWLMNSIPQSIKKSVGQQQQQQQPVALRRSDQSENRNEFRLWRSIGLDEQYTYYKSIQLD